MKKISSFWAILVFVVLSFSPAAFGANDTIKIGFIGCMSGVDAYLGQTAILALRDRVEEINAKGGIIGKKIELIAYDIGLDPTTETINATNRLIEQDKVVAIIGPESSDQAITAVDIVNNAKVPMIVTTASNETVTIREDGTLNEYMFRMCFIDSYQGKALANYAFNTMGIRKLAVLGDIANLYTQGIQQYFIKEFEALGGKITSEEGFTDQDTEFRAPLANIKNSDAEAILIATGTYKIAGFIGQQAKELGMNHQILGVDGWFAQEILTFAGPQLDGAILSNTMADDDPLFENYRKAFAEKHSGQSVNIFAYYALDALMSIEYAIIEANNIDPVQIKEKLENMVNVPVFTSNLTIDPATHNPLNKPIVILEIKDGKFVTKGSFIPES
jgi:branched-chain amino acid transport system substrate-binding protein